MFNVRKRKKQDGLPRFQPDFAGQQDEVLTKNPPNGD